MAPYTTILITLFLHHITFSAADPPPGATYPIYKDATDTQHYYTTLQIGTPPKTANFTLTLSSQLLWYICQNDNFTSTTYRPVPCTSKTCLVASRGITSCRSCDEPKPRPGCTNDTCTVMAYNPFDDVKSAETLYTDFLQVNDHPVNKKSVRVDHFPFLCAGSAFYYLNSLPKGNKGMLGLALSTVSLPAAVSAGLHLSKVFSLCLPSDGTGAILIGTRADEIVSNWMMTRMLINPYSTAPVHGSREEAYEYFIGVTAIKVGDVPVKLNKTLLEFHDYGYGGTKLSLDTPYTTLQTAIYEPVVEEFIKAAERVGLRIVGPIGNFSVCFGSESFKTTALPRVDFVLENDNVYWRMQGSGLMVRVSRSVNCLGVMDGGEKPRTAVVIGGMQMEERVVEFDWGAMVLRFGSSLREGNTTCSRSFWNGVVG